MRPGKPEGWWGCYPLTSPPTNQKNVHELITLSSNNYYKASYYPLQLGHTILSLLWPLLTDKAIFLIAKLDLNWNSLFKLLIDKFRHTLKKVGKTTRPFRYDLNQISYDYIVEVTNRFKRLDLIDKVPEELWTEVHDIVQEALIKTIQEKEMQKGKIAVWGGLTNSWEKKRRERQRRKGKIYTSECRVPNNSKKENLPQWSMQRDKGKQ